MMMDLKKGITLGVALLILTATLTGFYDLEKDEMAVIVSFPDMTIKTMTYSTVPHIITPLGGLYWHIPWPFEIVHKVSLSQQQYDVAVPILFSVGPNYYSIMTSNGFEYAHAYELSELEIMILHVDGEFQISNLSAWAAIDAYGRGKDTVENYISSTISQYIAVRIGELYGDLKVREPEMDDGELLNIISREIINDPTLLLVGFETYELKETVEEYTGIKLLKYCKVRISEESFSEYI